MKLIDFVRDATQADEIIEITRKSASKDNAQLLLKEMYHFTDEQCDLVMNSRLSDFESEFGPLPGVINYRERISKLSPEDRKKFAEMTAKGS